MGMGAQGTWLRGAGLALEGRGGAPAIHLSLGEGEGQRSPAEGGVWNSCWWPLYHPEFTPSTPPPALPGAPLSLSHVQTCISFHLRACPPTQTLFLTHTHASFPYGLAPLHTPRTHSNAKPESRGVVLGWTKLTSLQMGSFPWVSFEACQVKLWGRCHWVE